MLPTVIFIFIGPRASFLQEDNLSEMKWKSTFKAELSTLKMYKLFPYRSAQLLASDLFWFLTLYSFPYYGFNYIYLFEE